MEENNVSEGLSNKFTKLHEQYLSSPDGLSMWIDKEVSFWSPITTIIGANGERNNQVKRAISSYLSEISTMFLNVEPTEAFRKFVDIATRYKLPFHDEDVSVFVRESAAAGGVGLNAVIMAYQMALVNEEKNYSRLFQKDYLLLQEQVKSRIQSAMSDFFESKQTTIVEVKEEVGRAEVEIKNKVAAATEAIALSEPVKFWEARQNVHKEKAKNYGRLAFYSSLGFAFLLLLLIIFEYSSGRMVTVNGFEFILPKNNFGVAFLILITTAGIWSVRVFVKLMMANLALESESLERATMIKTFVAMTAVTGEMSGENQTLFFTTLFRPSNNSLSEDSTAPEFSRLLEAILQSRKQG